MKVTLHNRYVGCFPFPHLYPKQRVVHRSGGCVFTHPHQKRGAKKLILSFSFSSFFLFLALRRFFDPGLFLRSFYWTLPFLLSFHSSHLRFPVSFSPLLVVEPFVSLLLVVFEICGLHHPPLLPLLPLPLQLSLLPIPLQLSFSLPKLLLSTPFHLLTFLQDILFSSSQVQGQADLPNHHRRNHQIFLGILALEQDLEETLEQLSHTSSPPFVYNSSSCFPT
mmetsp:Transcript_39660/g.62722  ORF Transcript_39660/g.62722 Transcript_39660/m.62722 type:complete len:222 (+) Transcript_39660:235-900(+)